MLNEELRQIGFKLSVGDVERKLVCQTVKCVLTTSTHISSAII